MVKVP